MQSTSPFYLAQRGRMEFLFTKRGEPPGGHWAVSLWRHSPKCEKYDPTKMPQEKGNERPTTTLHKSRVRGPQCRPAAPQKKRSYRPPGRRAEREQDSQRCYRHGVMASAASSEPADGELLTQSPFSKGECPMTSQAVTSVTSSDDREREIARKGQAEKAKAGWGKGGSF